MKNCRRFHRAAILVVLAGSLMMGTTVSALASDISDIDLFKNIAYSQTANGNSVISAGTFFSADLNSTTANAYSSVTMSYPGPGSPVSLSQASSTDYHYQTALLPDQSTMDAQYPFGTYEFSATGTGGTDSESLDYEGDDYAGSVPYLTGTDFSDLQGMNASQSFTFHFSPFDTGGQANDSYLFFTIFDYTTNSFVYDAGFLSSSTTSLTLNANTLAAGQNYSYEIDFSNRDILPGSVDPTLGFDVRTHGLFSTGPAVPEPSSLLLLSTGLMGIAGALRRKLRR